MLIEASGRQSLLGTYDSHIALSRMQPLLSDTGKTGIRFAGLQLVIVTISFVAGCSDHPPTPHDSIMPKSFVDLIDEAKRDNRQTIETTLQLTDNDLEQLSEMPSISVLICDSGKLTDASIKHLVTLSDLQHLRLRHSAITDDGMKELAKISSLRVLNLPQADCTAAGIELLAELPNLTNIRLGSENLGQEAAGALAKLESLVSIHLIGVPIDDAGIRVIASMPNLESLYLDDSEVSDNGWGWLFEQHPDLHVHVDQRHLDRDPHSHPHE